MKQIVRLSLLLMLSTAMFTSCKKSAPKQTRHIPKNATFVAAINTKSIQSKLLKSQATVENLFKSIAGTDSTANKGKQEWEDFKNSGLDLDENFYISVVQKGGSMGSGKGASVFAGIGGLKDESKLEAYIKKKKAGVEIKKDKDYTYATIEGDNMVAWNEDLVIFLSSQSGSAGQMEFDSTTGTYNFKKPASAQGDLKLQMNEYFQLKEDASVASIPEFRELMQANADGSFWINSGASVEDLPIPLPKLKELLQNNFTAATLNFEDGKVVVNSKSFASPALTEIFKKYSGPSADLSLIETYPSSNINGFATISFNPELINAVIDQLEVRAFADKYIEQVFGPGYNSKSMVKALKGDLAFIVSDFNMPTTDPSTGMRMSAAPMMKTIFNLPIGDKVEMNKLMDKLVQMGMMVKIGNDYHATEAITRTGYQVSVDDKNLIVSSDSATLLQYKSRTGKAVLDKDVLGDFKGKTAAVYVNIESILNGFPANGQVAGASDIMAKAKTTFKDVRMSGDKFEGKYTAGHFELRLKNDKDNSLISLIQFFSAVAESESKQSKMRAEDLSIDTSTTSVDTTVVLPN